MRQAIMLFGLLFLVSFSAAAQDFPRFELFGGYTYTRINSSDGTTANANGGSVDVGIFPFRHFGIIADVGAVHDNGFTHDGFFYTAPSTSTHYLFGPRVRYGGGPVSVYLELLGGGIHRNAVVDSTPGDFSELPCFGSGCAIPFTFAPPENSWAISPAMGVDLRVDRFVSIRAIQVGGILTHFPNLATGRFALQANFTLSAGLVFHL